MADYMLMVLEDEPAHAALPAKAVAELIEKRTAFENELRRAWAASCVGPAASTRPKRLSRRQPSRRSKRGVTASRKIPARGS